VLLRNLLAYNQLINLFSCYRTR